MSVIPASIELGGSQIAVGNGRGGPTGGAGPIERLTLARPVLPCHGCAHAAVCAIRPLLDTEELALRTPPTPHEAIRIRLAVEIECRHFLAGEAAAPEPALPFRQTSADRRESSRRGAEASKRLRAAAKAPEIGGGSGEGRRLSIAPEESGDPRADAPGPAAHPGATAGSDGWVWAA